MKGFGTIVTAVLVLVLVLAAAALAKAGGGLSEGCLLTDSGVYDRVFTGNEGPIEVATWPFQAGEDILVTLEDLDGDHATGHEVAIFFNGTARDGTTTFPFGHSISGEVNDGFPLSLVIVDLEWDGDYAPLSEVTGTATSSFRLTARCAAQATPTERQQCMDGTWAALGFKNMGECIRAVVGQGGGG